MTTDFSKLIPDDQKRAILNDRILQFAVEGFNHSLNKELAVSVNDEQGVLNADKALALLEIALTINNEALNKLSPVL